MDWIATVIVGVLAFLGGSGVDRFYAAGRLRARLKEETALYSALPENSQLRPELLLHVERQAYLLIAEEEPLTTWEIMDRRWGRLYVYVVSPVLAVQFFLVDESFLQMAYGLLAVALFLYGQMRIARVERALNIRKIAKRSRADVDTSKYLVPTGRQMLAASLRSLLPPYRRPHSREPEEAERERIVTSSSNHSERDDSLKGPAPSRRMQDKASEDVRTTTGGE